MEFTISGDFTKKPVLKVDGKDISFETLYIAYSPPIYAPGYKVVADADENAANEIMDETCTIMFSVSEKIGALETGILYKATSSVDKLILVTVAKEDVPSKFKKFQKKKKKFVKVDKSPQKDEESDPNEVEPDDDEDDAQAAKNEDVCPDCGEPMDECTCDDSAKGVEQVTEEDETGTKPANVGPRGKRKDEYLKDKKVQVGALSPHTRPYKEQLFIEMAENIASTQK